MPPIHPTRAIRRPFRVICAVLPAALALASCGATSTVPSLGGPDVTRIHAEAPPGAAQGTCWGRETAPAIVETVTDQVLAEPAQIAPDGHVTRPAVFHTETRQRIVRERRDLWFRAPCHDVRTPDFTASLQRALKIRGHYSGPITGETDAATRRAIRSYQQAQGLDSDVLSLAAARTLGLVAIDRPAPES